MFMQANLKDGSKIISQFSKLGKVGAYAGQVFGGRKAFNAWEVVGDTHPVSGEKVLYRQRKLIAGSDISSLQVVKPKAGFETSHGFAPENFEQVVEMEHGRYGVFTVEAQDDGGLRPAGLSEDIPLGTEFPIRRDGSSLRKYIVVRAASEGQTERRYWLDTQTEEDVVQRPADAEDDTISEASLEDGDDDDFNDDID